MRAALLFISSPAVLGASLAMTAALACGKAVAQTAVTGAKPQQDRGVQSALKGDTALPPMPPGKATVIGGRIGSLDPVRDQFTLKVYGGQSIKVLYDPRTQLYRDGVRAPLRSLRPDERASVETTLDGTSVFALRIHMLSETPEGECRGQVAGREANLLRVRCDLTGDPVAFLLPAGVPVVRMSQIAGSPAAQAAVSDLTSGALVSVVFKPGPRGQGLATKVAIEAAPGASFVFTGELVLLDVHAGKLVVAEGDASYAISFDAGQLPESGALRQGERVTVTANFDGKGYIATALRPS